jgi:hypothetical protein
VELRILTPKVLVEKWTEGVENVSPPKGMLWHIDYFELKVLETHQVQMFGCSFSSWK